MSDGSAFTGGFHTAYRMMMDREEKKQQEEANKSLMNAFIAMEEQRKQAAVAPEQQKFDIAQKGALDAQMVKEASGMTDSLMANNPNFTQRLQGQTAPVAPEQAPVLAQQFQQTNQTNLNNANTQAQSAQDLLAQAEAKYAPSVLAKIAPMVGGNVSFEKLMAVADNLQGKEDARQKEIEANKIYGEVFTNTKLTNTQKAAMLAKYNPTLASAFARRDDSAGVSGKVELKNGNIGFYTKDGKIVDSGQPFYVKPEKPTGQLTEYQKWQMEKDKANPAEKTQNIPGFGNITNAQIMSLYNSAQPTTSEHEAFNPMTGQKEKMQTTNPGKPETIALLKPYVDKIKGIATQAAPSGNSLGDPLLDAALAEIRQNGAEAAQGKLAAKFGTEKAKQIMGQVSLFLQEK